ncbi:DNA-binding response OmpR family regulator [Rhodoglobus vestalii]|uniref:DNA-binding response OmpR family regulator n=1 Tax=Rhodoglobus vestalii TaxID=193384 RepID=A0A8H2KAE3_9MICO|nr:response regulator transcription factor [Rhodoglobus vestalii]TQO20606.1 DNA-binding response OmpR family regulator [Rhodoglobus vestalii]
MGHTILLVEDDDGIAIPLLRTLEREGYGVEWLAEGLPAIARAASGQIDLVVLDLGLPDIDGLEVCRRMRADGVSSSILILTARGGELDRVVGLDVGADDYLAKPFALAELLARTRALLRRGAPRPQTDAAEESREAPASTLRIDADARRVWEAQRELQLTSKEFDILALLSQNRGAVVTRERLMDEVWDENWFGSTKTLDVTIGRLRQKLEDSASATRVVTVRGVGFRLEDNPTDA